MLENKIIIILKYKLKINTMIIQFSYLNNKKKKTNNQLFNKKTKNNSFKHNKCKIK